MDKRLRVTALVGALAVMLAACGTRLSEEDRDLVISGLTAGGGAGGVAAPAATDGAAGTAATTTGEGQTTDTATGDAGTAGSTAAGGSTAGTDGGGSAATGGTTGSGGQAQTDTRAAPPGGNGGATDVGVTETSITIYNVVDVNGAVQGLFEDAKDATTAYWAYFASTEGTIYGRELKQPVFKDAQLSTQANRSAYLEACKNGFAAVGSMSAFEQGAVDPIKECGILDVRTAAVSPEVQTLPTMVSTLVLKPGQVALSEWTYYKEVVGDGVKKAAYLWIDNATTAFQTGQNREATSKDLGYEWVVKRPIGLSETNYASIVQELKSAGVQFVAFQGDASQAVRIGEAMQQQNWYPQIFALQSNTYGQKLLDGLAGKPQELVSIYRVAQPGALVEEIDSNPEMQLYAEWLNRVKPGAKPTGLGMYAWGAMKMFVDAVKAVGPNLTRQAVLDELKKLEAYTGNGLFPPQNQAAEVATDCVIMLRIDGGQFTRAEPGTEYRCRPQPAFL